MGMFDEIRCEYPVPDVEVQDHVFQTKDFNNFMEHYTITKEGRLIYHKTRTEEVPENERPYWGKPEWEDDLYKLMGSLRDIPVGDVDMNFHGVLNFYTSTGDCNTMGDPDTDYKWYEYNAKFTDGNLVSISRRL